MKRAFSSKEFFIVLLLLLTKLLIHLLTNTNYEVHRDGLLYYSLGEHLSWGYVSVPPFIALISKISVGTFGNTAFALRFFPMLVGLTSIIVIADIILHLGGRWKAILIAGIAFILSPAFLRSNTLFQPVSFNQFFWLLTFYLVIKMIKRNKPKLWVWVFFVLGIAFLNKYSIVFFGFGLILTLLFSRHRWLFHSKYFLMGVALAFIMVLPNLIWQYQHNWPIIHHMGELYKNQLVNVSYVGFLIDQLIMNLPGLIVWLAAIFLFLFKFDERKYRFIVFVWFIIVVLLLLNHGKSYYILGLYTVLFALGAYAIEKYWHNWAISTLAFFIISTGILMAPISLPIFSFKNLAEFTKPMADFTNRWEDGKVYKIPQDFADMTGWEQLAKKVDSCYSSFPDYKQRQTKIFADNYGQAGAISFYNKIIEPISFNDNYILWAPESVDLKSLIMINHKLDKDLCQYFDTCYVMAQVNDLYFRENGVQIIMYDGAKPEFNNFYKQQLNKHKLKYIRN